MSRVLVLFAHPALEKSRVHRAMLSRIPQDPRLTVNDLYEAYPRLDIDVSREQDLLTAHDTVVFQFPFYWYSTPPMLKQWQDLVLLHGWAYGSTGNALEGKSLICAVSTGGGEGAYEPEGYNRHTVRELLAPIEQTAALCKMRFLPPWVVYGTHRLGAEPLGEAGAHFGVLLEGLLNDRIDPSDPGLEGMKDLNPLVQSWSGEVVS
jgi:glutathione-regulated potassium-efflux system ancillary protein KefG